MARCVYITFTCLAPPTPFSCEPFDAIDCVRVRKVAASVVAVAFRVVLRGVRENDPRFCKL
jgi:hypothetical protein